jgi:hypothetical protein
MSVTLRFEVDTGIFNYASLFANISVFNSLFPEKIKKIFINKVRRYNTAFT